MLKLSGLIWSRHASVRLKERFGLRPGQVKDAIKVNLDYVRKKVFRDTRWRVSPLTAPNPSDKSIYMFSKELKALFVALPSGRIVRGGVEYKITTVIDTKSYAKPNRKDFSWKRKERSKDRDSLEGGFQKIRKISRKH